MSHTVDDLSATLKAHGRVSSIQNQKDVFKILNELKERIREYIEQVPNGTGAAGGTRLVTSGDFHVETERPGQATDVIALIPVFVSDQELESGFKAYMERDMDIVVIRTACRTPEFYVDLNDAKICVSFVRVEATRIPTILDISKDDFLETIDRNHLAAVQHARIAEDLRKLVHAEIFSKVYRAVALYAKGNGIFSKETGFLGELGWKCLVAFVCIKNGTRSSPTVLKKVFETLKSWPWPKPMMIKKIPTTHRGSFDAQVWRPGSGGGRIPIITPSYPESVASPELSKNSVSILMDEAARAMEICERVISGNALWNDLFEPKDEFEPFEKFLVLVLTTPTDEDAAAGKQVMMANIQELVRSLDANTSVERFHAFEKTYKPVRMHNAKVVSTFVVGLTPTPSIPLCIDEDVDIFMVIMKRRFLTLKYKIKAHIADKSDLHMFASHNRLTADEKAMQESAVRIEADKEKLESLDAAILRAKQTISDLESDGRIFDERVRASRKIESQSAAGPPKVTVELQNAAGTTIGKKRKRIAKEAAELIEPYVFSTGQLTTETLRMIANDVTSKTGESIELGKLRKYIYDQKKRSKKTEQ